MLLRKEEVKLKNMVNLPQKLKKQQVSVSVETNPKDNGTCEHWQLL